MAFCTSMITRAAPRGKGTGRFRRISRESHEYGSEQEGAEAAGQVKPCGAPEHDAAETARHLASLGVLRAAGQVSGLKSGADKIHVDEVTSDENPRDGEDPVLMMRKADEPREIGKHC